MPRSIGRNLTRHSKPLHKNSALIESLEERRLLANFVVNTLLDGPVDAGLSTLRAAIEQANATPGGDQITFADGLAGTILLGEDPLLISEELSIQGPGATSLSIGRTTATTERFNLFQIENASTGDFVVTLSGLRLFGSGVAIDNSKVLIVEDALIEDNGRGIHNRSVGNLTVSRTTFNDNGIFSWGGSAIFNQGAAAVSNSSITGNRASIGGGIHNNGTLVIDRSLLAGNQAFDFSGYRPTGSDYFGGGVYNSGTLTIRSSTISGNSSQQRGGGIANDGSLTIYNSTIANNFNYSSAHSAGIDQSGAPSLLASSIVAGNYSFVTTPIPGQLPSDLGGTGSYSVGSMNNLIGDAATASGFVNGVSSNIVGADPLLRPLGDYGGLTHTHQLTAGSPAIDSGANPLGIDTDQRELPRTRGTAADIGAVESDFPSGYSLQTIGDGTVSATADTANAHRVLIRTTNGSLVVFEQGWQAVNLQAATGSPAAIGDGAIWTDPKNGLVYAMAIGENSEFMLYQRSASGVWSYRNLSAEPNGPPFLRGAFQSYLITQVRAVTQFTALGGRVFVGFLIDTLSTLDGGQPVARSNELVYMEQTGLTDSQGRFTWSYTDMRQALTFTGQSLPVLNTLISYVTPWNAWHFAGLDAQGQIVSVWRAPTLQTWRVDNLSQITGAPTIEGGLSAVLTSWSGINLTGVDASGRLIVTWWIPSFGADWVSSDLTEITNGPAIQAATLTGYGTSWDGMNYVGLDEQGRVIVFWWAPASNAWNVVPLYDAVSSPGTPPVPTGRMTSFASAGGTLNVLGSNQAGDAIRISIQPATQALWQVENLSTLAVRR